MLTKVKARWARVCASVCAGPVDTYCGFKLNLLLYVVCFVDLKGMQVKYRVSARLVRLIGE
jgi:hypothetical protein